jgi:para-nitrobenzyl esterase
MVSPTFGTPSGRVRGSSRGTGQDEVAVYRAVPVATTSPFGAPAPAEPWTGTLDCTDSRERRNLRGDGTVTVFAPTGHAAGTRLPVIAWVHGGRYEEGHGDDGWYDGTTLARSGCIVVTLNYRKRFAGFLPLDGESTGDAARGVSDLVQALQWIRDAAPELGGDPANITLAGQSAGGGLIIALLADRRADALFRRAMVLSPGLPRIGRHTGWRVRRAVARAFLRTPLTRSRLEALSGERRHRAYRRTATVYSTDCAVGPGPVDFGDLREVPLLVSTMQDEFVRFPGVQQLDRVLHLLHLSPWFVSPGMLLLGVPWRSLRRWVRAVDPVRPMGQTVGDTMIRWWAAGLLESARGEDVWACEFRGGEGVDALHCGELPLLFDTLQVGKKLVRAFCGAGAQERLGGPGGAGERFRSTVVAFAHGEDPGWERYTHDRSAHVFDLTGGEDREVTDPLREIRTLMPVR